MSVPCDIIRDLLPLYCDGSCSEESRALVEEHLQSCETCKEEQRLMSAEFRTATAHTNDLKIAKAAAAAWKKAKKKAALIGAFAPLIVCACMVLGILLWVLLEFWPKSPPEPNWMVRVDGLVRGEVYFYGPSHDNLREAFHGSDEERKLVLLDGRPVFSAGPEFHGGDLYRMAMYFNGYTYIELDALPEDSYTVFQYNIYYEDGNFTTVHVYPHALSINGSFYTVEGDGSWDTSFVENLEREFWTISYFY